LIPGASLADLDKALETISARAKVTVATEFPEYQDWRLSAGTWNEAVLGDQRLGGVLLLAVGGVVLLVACINLTSLLLARLATRGREFAVRRALGASAWRISRLLIMESLLVAGVAAVAGIGLTRAALLAAPSLLPGQIARIGLEFPFDVAAVSYCVLAGVCAALLTAVLPAWHTRRSSASSLADANRAVAGPSRQRWRRALIVTELALAVTLLVTAGLFARSYARIANIDPGFDSSGLLTMRLTIDPRVYPGNQAADFFGELTSRLSTLPGVAGVSALSQLPTTARFDTTFTVEGQPATGDVLPNALLNVTSPQVFDVLRTPIRAGRALTDRDRAGTPAVVVVNEAFSRRYLNNATSGSLRVGQRQTQVEVVGVVADISNQSLTGPVRPEIFATLSQAGQGNNQYFLVVRAEGDPRAHLSTIRTTLAQMDPNQPLYFIQTMEEVLATGVFPQRLAMTMVGVFAAGAIMLAIVGLYGLISNWVVSRRREIGIRLALGGNSRQLVGLVVGQVARLVVTGSLIGLIGGVGAGSAVSSLLFATTPADPWTLLGVVVVLAVVGLMAAVLPARRAMVVDPIEVLRAE
jgi:predicted permease